ncbi:helix-turn-helix domain-containing protein [Fulvivirgaceae bacterium PWU4]|uniref:Helix-turn-helix domain-containing protein n=1 Tax=Chryseosolibacter histidini TaxID=2782349 RepID=A0AAP2DIJ3_9BACT|nr:helix-turn-helix domain-containing protein [Chryseosolibacter histidini]MBT1697023.1 helix-turn-helix domain-containing protein [Chryseosolibacter histidini]
METIPVRHFPSVQCKSHATTGFVIRDVRDLLAGKDIAGEPHRHNFFFMLALEKGAGDHKIDFQSFPVNDRSVFFLRPGQAHQLTLKAGSTGYLMQFDSGFYYPDDKPSRKLLRQASHQNVYQPDAGDFEKLGAVLSYIFREYATQGDGYQQIIKANLSIFFIELLRQKKNATDAGDVNTYAQERLEELLELLETHIIDHKQVSQYADMLNLSPYQLNAITKTTLGKTCSELINDQVVLEAKRFLLGTTSQVNQIACDLGYDDASYFTRFFKKQTGYSPETFRHNFR